jgi:hypothetical protein
VASASEDGDRPQWLTSDGQAWARLVDEVLGPAQACVTRQVPPLATSTSSLETVTFCIVSTAVACSGCGGIPPLKPGSRCSVGGNELCLHREETTSWAYLGDGSSAGGSPGSSPRGGNGASGAGSLSRAATAPAGRTPRRQQRHGTEAAAADSHALLLSGSVDSVPDFMTLRWTGRQPAAPLPASAPAAAAESILAAWPWRFDDRPAAGSSRGGMGSGHRDSPAVASLQQELSLRTRAAPAEPVHSREAATTEAVERETYSEGGSVSQAAEAASLELGTASSSATPQQELSKQSRRADHN